MELRDYLRVLRARWASIVLLTLLTVGAAGVVSLVVTPQYEAETRLFVSTASGSSVDEQVQGNTFLQQRVRSYPELITSDRVLGPVIERLGLEETTAELEERVSAEAPADTAILNVTVEDTSARRAADTANAIAEAFDALIGEVERPGDDQPVPVRITVVDPAVVPEDPAFPNLPLNLALSVVLGLALGTALAVARESLDTRIRGEADLKKVTEVPVIGGLPDDPQAHRQPLVAADDPHGVRSEAFRQLRTNLQFVTAAQDARSVVVTSSLEGEGKSTTAINLAITMANAGVRVALVDADLRRPMVAGYMGLEGGVGLTTALIGRAAVGDLLQPWGPGNNLDVLVAGEVPPNPSELLGAPVMEKVLRELESTHDIVVLDGAPLLPVTDSAVLSRIAGGALLVVAAQRAERPQVERALGTLTTVQARVLGVVLTRLPTRGPDAYATYGYAAYAANNPDTKRGRGAKG